MNNVKRLCVGCSRLTAPSDAAYQLRSYHCMCNNCNDTADAELERSAANEPAGIPPSGDDFHHRYEE